METVTSCKPIKVWEKDGKKVQIYEVTLSDGTKGESFGKEIPEGTAQEALDITEGQYGKKIKLKSVGGGGWGGGKQKQRSGNESFALSYSKDVWVAQINQGNKEFTSKECLMLADKFFQWLESKKQ